jgi:hypothetical protein
MATLIDTVVSLLKGLRDDLGGRLEALEGRAAGLEARILAVRDGAPGYDGAPGPAGPMGPAGPVGVSLGFEELAGVTYDGDRSFTWTFRHADGRSKVFRVEVAGLPLYRDVYTDGKTYTPGDLVTWGGSMWIAKQPTATKPGSGPAAAAAWRLCVKSGRDGRQGPAGPVGPTGPTGARGPEAPRQW